MEPRAAIEHTMAQGIRVPSIGLGTWQLRGDRCERTVELALSLGYRHIDTASMYGNEAAVGVAIRRSGINRGDLWITTKLSPNELTAAGVQRGTYESLERLGLEYVDLLLIHWPSTEVPLAETLDAMQLMMEIEAVRSVGVSNFSAPLLEEACRLAPIFATQVEYHPYLAQPTITAVSRARDLLLVAYSPLARGRVASDPTIRRIARRYGKSPAQVALRWLLDQPNVAAIPKASTEDHLRENIDVFDFRLSASEMETIAALERGERLIGAPPRPAP
jgi:2,5-diketo-D-gluconate reductase B